MPIIANIIFKETTKSSLHIAILTLIELTGIPLNLKLIEKNVPREHR